LPGREALWGLLVELRGNAGWPAVLGESADHDNVLIRALPNPQLIAQVERFGPLRALPIDLNLPAIDRLSREAAGLEKPRGPKPLVEPYVFR